MRPLPRATHLNVHGHLTGAPGDIDSDPGVLFTERKPTRADTNGTDIVGGFDLLVATARFESGVLLIRVSSLDEIMLYERVYRCAPGSGNRIAGDDCCAFEM
jgi:hypothetical protein